MYNDYKNNKCKYSLPDTIQKTATPKRVTQMQQSDAGRTLF